MKKIEIVEVYLGINKVGRLAQTRDGICAFEYDANYLLFSAMGHPIKD